MVENNRRPIVVPSTVSKYARMTAVEPGGRAGAHRSGMNNEVV